MLLKRFQSGFFFFLVSNSIYSESCYSNVSISSHSSVGAPQGIGTVANFILSWKSWGLHHRQIKKISNQFVDCQRNKNDRNLI